MNSTAIQFSCRKVKEETVSKTNIATFILKITSRNERKLLKAFLLSRLHQLFIELFRSRVQCYQNNFSMECYTMDCKIIQLVILGIVETGEYTLEGIALYTHIPFDVIYDAACGNNNQLSITPWSRVVDLYLQVKPDIAQILINKLIKFKDQHHTAFSLLLKET